MTQNVDATRKFAKSSFFLLSLLVKKTFSPLPLCLFDFIFCSTFPVSHCSVARTEMFPAAYANTFCFQRKLFVSFPTFCREKNVEMMFKLVAGAIQQAEGQDVGGLLHLLHIHLCQPLHPPDDRYSRVSLATRMDLSVHPTITGVYYLKKFPSTSSYFDRIIPLYPPDDHFSRVSLATGINQTWSMRPSKEWLVSSTSKSAPYF